MIAACFISNKANGSRLSSFHNHISAKHALQRRCLKLNFIPELLACILTGGMTSVPMATLSVNKEVIPSIVSLLGEPPS